MIKHPNGRGRTGKPRGGHLLPDGSREHRYSRQLAAEILRRLSMGEGTTPPPKLHDLASITIKVRNGRHWPISLRTNSRLQYRDQIDRHRRHPRSRRTAGSTRPRIPEALGCATRRGSGAAGLDLIPNGRARRSGRNGTAANPDNTIPPTQPPAGQDRAHGNSAVTAAM